MSLVLTILKWWSLAGLLFCLLWHFLLVKRLH